MAESTNAPYATPTNVLAVIGRYRERGLPDPITRKTLESLGIAYSVAGHVFGALRFLGLIDDEGHRTDQFERLRRAATDEYREVLAEVIRAAYHEVLTIVDPMQDSITTVNDAFRHFEPAAQRDRMVTLFLGLCREAGLAPEARQRRQAAGGTRTPPSRTQPGPARGRATATVDKPPTSPPPPRTPVIDEPNEEMPDYRLLNVLLSQLPRDGRWNRAWRDQWIATMTNAVDLVVKMEEGKV